MTRNRRAVALGIASLLAAFAAGVAVGWAWRPPLPTAEERVLMIREEPDLFDGLDLTEDQRVAIDSVMASLGSWSDSLVGVSSSAIRRRTVSANEAILGILTPEQQARYQGRLDSVRIYMRIRREPIRP